MEPLPSPSDPMPVGYARGINNRGEVVGVVADGPFIWDSVAGMRNLNDLLDSSGDGWVLTHAYDINDRGQIVGFGSNPDGYTHGFQDAHRDSPSNRHFYAYGYTHGHMDAHADRDPDFDANEHPMPAAKRDRMGLWRNFLRYRLGMVLRVLR